MVCAELGELKNSVREQSAYQIVRSCKVKGRIHKHQFISFRPTADGSVRIHGIIVLLRQLDHSVSQIVHNLREPHVQRIVKKDQGQHTCSYHKQYLKCVDIDEPFDPSTHSIDRADDTEYDDRPDYELKIYSSKANDGNRDGRDKKP